MKAWRFVKRPRVTECRRSKFDEFMHFSLRFCGQGRRGDAGRVTSTVDTGIAVNPDTVMAQLQGGLVFGLTARLYGDETSATASIPALRNAIYAATGVALRRMPVQRNLLKVARI